MRPARLELEGFSAYREPTVVDFDGVDLFALTGATGAGKTAVLDAIAFALYGVVHRLANKTAVAPAISQGAHEARVRLDFVVDGQRWTATRVVRRTKGGGASTVEARLEGPGGVVAGTADEVTDAVTGLLGLTYDHFTRCVVLPQGEFARFLHDTAGDRQKLLVSLLDLGLYGRMAERARGRASDAATEAARLEGRLSELDGATPEAVAAAAERVDELAGLLAALDAELPTVADLAAAEDAARAEADVRTAEAERLAAVVVPGDVAALSTAAKDAAAALVLAEAAWERADADLEVAQKAVAELPERSALESLLVSFDRLAKGELVVAERQAAAEVAAAALQHANARLEEARASADLVAAAHRAHAVKADIVLGEPCPVCEQVVSVIPTAPPPADLAAGRAAVAAAERAAADAAARHAAADRDLATAVALLEQVTADIAGRNRTGVEADLAAVVAAADALAAATSAARECRSQEKAARAAASTAAAALDDARTAFDTARDAVAPLGAPPRTGGDLAAEWAALADWAAAETPGRQAAAIAAAEKADELAGRRQGALEGLAERCAAAGVQARAGEQVRDAAAGAHARAAAERDRLAEQFEVAAKVRARHAEVAERRDVARALATHLDARHFEQWVLDEAVRALAEGATELLRTLSGGHYSLDVDGRGAFVVVDHRNADETRSARTLSGGETFLASLALALALADRIATMAAGGAAGLDAIFLDEGFGTLDADTLDVVATAIEELGAAGRMVGVVSHVAELAERVPVRFEVARTGTTSTITRVDR